MLFAAFLRLGNKVLAPFLTAYFEIALEFVFFPHIFKTAKVIPVFKTGKRNLTNNYRPISLLLSLSKVLEKLIKIPCFKLPPKLLALNCKDTAEYFDCIVFSTYHVSNQ